MLFLTVIQLEDMKSLKVSRQMLKTLAHQLFHVLIY